MLSVLLRARAAEPLSPCLPFAAEGMAGLLGGGSRKLSSVTMTQKGALLKGYWEQARRVSGDSEDCYGSFSRFCVIKFNRMRQENCFLKPVEHPYLEAEVSLGNLLCF